MRSQRGSVRDKSGGRGLYWELRVRHDGGQPSRGFKGDPALDVDTNRALAVEAMERFADELAETLTVQSTCADMLWMYWRRRCRNNTPARNADMRQKVRAHLIPLCGSRRIVDVEEHHVATWYEQLRAKGLGRETVRKLHFILRPAFALAKRYKVIADNPCGDSPAETKELVGTARKYRKGSAAPIDQIAAIYKVASDRGELDTCLYIRLLIITGDRRSELCGLRWRDIDWQGSSLVLLRSVVVVEGDLYIQPFDPFESGEDTVIHRADGTIVARKPGDDSPGKGDPLRPQAIDPGTMEAIVEYRAYVAAAGGGVDPDAFVFADWDRAIDGSIPRRPSTWTSRWAAHRRRAGHPKLQMKAMRTGSISWQMQAGLNPVDIARRHGHSRTSTTIDTYSQNIVPNADRDAAELMGARFEQIHDHATGQAPIPPDASSVRGLSSRPTKVACQAPCGCDRVAVVKGPAAAGLDHLRLCQGHYAQGRAGKDLAPLRQYSRTTARHPDAVSGDEPRDGADRPGGGGLAIAS